MTLHPPDTLPEDGILVAWSLEHEHGRQPLGFRFDGGNGGDNGGGRGTSDGRTLDPILFTGEGHLMTIAPTGAGKGVGAIIPALLRHPGSVIVIDPKGENAAVTARRRREMGQQVAVLDPFGIAEDPWPATFNPLDLIDMSSPDGPEDCVALAAQMVPILNQRDPFWDHMARNTVAALLAHVASSAPRPLRNIGEVHYLLSQSYKDLDLTGFEMSKSRIPFVRTGSSLLSANEPKVRASIIATARANVNVFGGPRVQANTKQTERLDPMALVEERPVSIYLVLPPEKLDSHAALLRLWVGTLIRLVLRRRRRAETATLFLIDEAAQLGPLDEFRQAVTLLRGYGLQTWSFWQDLSQLQHLYAHDWRTMLNNCRGIQAFGFNTLAAARSVCEVTGFPDAVTALELDRDEMLLQLAGDTPVIAQRPNYLTDAPFAGLADANPYHGAADADELTARQPQRLAVRITPQATDPDPVAARALLDVARALIDRSGPPPTDPERHAVDLLARRFTGSALDLQPTGGEGPFDETDPPDPAKPKGPQRNPVLERMRAELKAKKAAQAAAANAAASADSATPDAANKNDGDGEGESDADAIADAWEAALGTDKPDDEPGKKTPPEPDDDGTG